LREEHPAGAGDFRWCPTDKRHNRSYAVKHLAERDVLVVIKINMETT